MHRKTKPNDYGNLSAGAKDELRHSLVREQRGLCCYCMSRIRPDRRLMKIEHWRSQKDHESEQLNYRNLLGACLGGHGQPPSKQHCDTKKSEKAIKWNPADPQHQIESRIVFEPDGSIQAHDPEFNGQLADVLGLNLAWLKSNRKAKITAIAEWWMPYRHIRDRSVRDRLVQRKRSRYANGDQDLPEYCQVVVHWLDKKLSKSAL